MFLDHPTRVAQDDWDSVPGYLVATFRAQTVRAGENGQATELLTELLDKSAEFLAIWADNDARSTGEGIKRINHHSAGPIALEFSSLAVDSRPDLKLLTYTPAGSEDAAKIQHLCQGRKTNGLRPGEQRKPKL
ncbi:MAG: hypothetical protein AAF590_08985 [Pseudomonadota bacterium]